MKPLLLSLLFPLFCQSQPWIFYNLENLFDTINDHGFHDEEFTPEGGKEYTSIRYRLCLRQSARVLNALQQGGNAAPVIGLCEIENRSVLEDLINHKGMRNHGPWGIVHYDSPDHRGIDCALIYKSDQVQVIDSDRIRYSNDTLPTRDALFVRYIHDSTFYNIVVVHLPSKSGGAIQSQWKRAFAWQSIFASVDTCKDPTIIIGDFNDEVGGSQTKYFPDRWRCSIERKSKGSYKYKGRWNTIDGAIANFTVNARICNLSMLQEKDTKWGGFKPRRRWQGTFFKNGYSDHLPVYFSEVEN
jgi:predicted extracellular nuclease